MSASVCQISTKAAYSTGPPLAGAAARASAPVPNMLLPHGLIATGCADN